MPATRLDKACKKRKQNAQEQTRKKERIADLIGIAYSRTPQERRTEILGKSEQTVMRRIERPQDLTLGELETFIRFGYETPDKVRELIMDYLKN